MRRYKEVNFCVINFTHTQSFDMSTNTTTTTIIRPLGYTEVKTALLEINIGCGSVLWVMNYFGKMLFVFNEGNKQAHSAYLSEQSSADNTYDSVTWRYFFLDDLLVVSCRYSFLTVKLPPLVKFLRQGITKISEAQFDLLLSGRQELLKTIAQREKSLAAKEESLNQIRLNTDASDFAIICQDETSIPVHTPVLSTFWPFFKNMISHDCQEKTERILRLNFPADWITSMVSHIYNQTVKLTFDQATGLLILAEMYLLPDLTIEVERQIRSLVKNETTIEDLITGWERAREANNDKMRRFFAHKISNKSPRENEDKFKGWEAGKVLELYFDNVEVV